MQRTPAGEVVIVPRNFKLLQELEKSEKGLGEMGLSMGLVDPGDTFLSHWNAGILVIPPFALLFYTPHSITRSYFHFYSLLK
jgi:hypothetical protein